MGSLGWSTQQDKQMECCLQHASPEARQAKPRSHVRAARRFTWYAQDKEDKYAYENFFWGQTFGSYVVSACASCAPVLCVRLAHCCIMQLMVQPCLEPSGLNWHRGGVSKATGAVSGWG